MSTAKKTCLFLIVTGMLAFVLSFTLYRDNRKGENDAILRIGAGNDITGLFMGDLVESIKDTELNIELTTFIDCCGTSSQWAMTSGNLDAGFYCSSIALILIERNKDLEIYNPAVLNAEMVALSYGTGSKDEVYSMAVPMNRTFLNDIVSSNFSSVEEVLQGSTTSLHYALSERYADGAVVDIARAFQAPGFDYIPLSDEEYISYCLVVNKNIVDTPQFIKFLSAYNHLVDDYNDIEFLKERFDMSDSFWQAVNVKFLRIN